MQTYTAPLRDMRFVLHELHDSGNLSALPGLTETTPDLLDTVLEEAAKFIASVLLPLNASGDAEGCHYENGMVRTPRGFKEAYRAFVEAGWGALNSDPRYGGQGLPESVAKLVEEMICGCNLAFGLYPGLSHGAYIALHSHGSEALKDLYLPKLVDGSWAGTMCLTEAHCGTDLGLLRTHAVPQPDGSYRVSGSKIFISAGDHDLAENIVHLVLARIDGAPPGIKGISLFVIPKFLPTAAGGVGARNGVTCAGIEHKMGIKASATCQINFDGAAGWLVGEPHKGMRAMFVMMNSERLAVGTQGLGVGEIAYQSAVAYARDRVQGRSLGGPKYPQKSADPIIVHPDVRRMLMTMRAYNEGCRALGVWVANALDRMERLPESAARTEAEDFVALMTPVVKALFTDLGFESANLALQTHGGHGFIVDHGMEQFVRDARIAMIYEGTNGIQALDLVGRKMPANMGRSLRRFFHPVAAFIDANSADPQVGSLIQQYARAFGALQLATSFIAQKSVRDPEEAGAASTDYLRMFGLVALGFMWVRMAKVAADKLPTASGEDADFYKAKRATATFFVERILPQAGALLYAIKAGKSSTMSLEEAAF
ncbi:MAG: acyl-CoA dehydrogenase C-terminal domain-containing protein [Steroidobacteraceae bacterium]